MYQEKGMTEDEMVGWHHWLNGHEFEQTEGDSEGQGSLACCSSRDCKESETSEQLKDNNVPGIMLDSGETVVKNTKKVIVSWGKKCSRETVNK